MRSEYLKIIEYVTQKEKRLLIWMPYWNITILFNYKEQNENKHKYIKNSSEVQYLSFG